MEIEAKLKKYRLTRDEHERITKLLGHAPEGLEWALFSALWSEHCSYKSSRRHLKRFQFRSERVLESFGENAGVIDLGQGERIAFKMESHNHPSFIEPYQGAATGVGGILRDIFTMGARPIALADYLCFGEPQAERMTALVDGVVRGIGGYGNCVGVPTVTGQTEFHASYNNNILVNALALGLFRPGEPVVTSRAAGVGNLVVYVGAKTGRDGIHGASMASEAFDASSASKRPTVQIGDPFYEKLLIESCLEVMQSGLVVAIQDMGAAGLTSSSFEMAAKGGVGFHIDLDRVPLRDPTLTPEDILLSESQERMLLISTPENLAPIQKIFSRWGLEAEPIGRVTEGPEVELYWRGERVIRIDPKLLTDQAPIYDRPYRPWELRTSKLNEKNPGGVTRPSVDAETISSTFAMSREWIYRQYDQRVGGKTIRDAGHDVAVLRLPDSGRGLGLVLGCRPHLMRFDAFLGAKDAVAYPALALASKGFRPLALTDCLNFGNPERPEIMSEFVASVEGLAVMSEAIEAPIISGNVSFYNETMGRNITSTPATGVVGLKESIKQIPLDVFPEPDLKILMLWSPQVSWSGRVAELDRTKISGTGDISPQAVRAMMEALLALVESVNPAATRVVGQGGLGVTLTKMLRHGIGAEIELGSDLELWREDLYQVVVVAAPKSLPAIREVLSDWLSRGGRLRELGVTRQGLLRIHGVGEWTAAQISKWQSEGWRRNFESLA